jgi:hypothetical protein
MRIQKTWCPFAALALAAALRAQADATDYDRDLVVLKPEKAIECRILRVDEKQVVTLQGSREVVIKRDQVVRFERSLDLCEEFLTRAHKHEKEKDAGGLLQLAGWCEEKRLRRFAQNCHLAILLIDPQHETANKALKHVRGSTGWLVPFKGAALPFAEVLKRRGDWGSAWELSSLHYDLRTDAPLPRALQLLRDLEWFYLTFFALFGTDLHLDDRTERMVAHVYKDHAKVPKPSSTSAAYFDPAARTLYTGFEGGRTGGFPVALDHEATHQVFFHTLRFRATGGSVPGWLDEGLAEYLRTVIERDAPGGQPKVDPGRRDRACFQAAASGREYRIERLLTLEADDFYASTGQAEKYANSYAWVHYLQFGDGGAWRIKFRDFVREAYAGKGTSSTFKKLMGADLERMKKGFDAYIRAP